MEQSITETTFIPLHFTNASNRRLFLISSGKALVYAVILRHRINQHFCAYINVDKWMYDHRVVGFESRHSITYEGIGSTDIDVPTKVRETLPIHLENYWVGIDFFQKEEPEIREILERLLKMIEDLFGYE